MIIFKDGKCCVSLIGENVIKISGELEFSSHSEFVPYISKTLKESGKKEITFDLVDLFFINSCAIKGIIDILLFLEENNVSITIIRTDKIQWQKNVLFSLLRLCKNTEIVVDK